MDTSCSCGESGDPLRHGTKDKTERGIQLFIWDPVGHIVRKMRSPKQRDGAGSLQKFPVPKGTRDRNGY